MITYTEIRGSSRGVLNVYLDEKWVGVICKGANGFFYKPKGSRNSGDEFATIEQVKQSLES